MTENPQISPNGAPKRPPLVVILFRYRPITHLNRPFPPTEHIKKFRDPRMRKAIFAHMDNGGTGLDPYVRDALEVLKKA